MGKHETKGGVFSCRKPDSGNAQLIDILLNNLLSNATRHNAHGGTIHISLQEDTLEVSNSGEPNSLDQQSIFNRFYKGNSFTGRHGLGLSIVKQICEVSGYTCQYHFRQPATHSFVIQWNQHL